MILLWPARFLCELICCCIPFKTLWTQRRHKQRPRIHFLSAVWCLPSAPLGLQKSIIFTLYQSPAEYRRTQGCLKSGVTYCFSCTISSTLWITLAIPIICCYVVLLCSLWWIVPHPCTAHVHAISKLLLCWCRQMFCNFPVVGHTYRHSQQAFRSAHYLFTPFAIEERLHLSFISKRTHTCNNCLKGPVFAFEVTALKCGELSKQSQEECLI